MKKLTFRHPKTKQTQEVGENETVKLAVLRRLGWREGNEPEPVEMPKKLPSEGQPPAKNVPNRVEAESHQPAKPKRKRRTEDE